jgi:tRNA (guanine-N7-)-methyltransferase
MGAAAKKQKRAEIRKKIAAAESGEGSPAAAVMKLPQKKYYRQRAHANPFSDHLLK